MDSRSDWTPTICTHSGRFHCDEVTATAMLKYLYNITELSLIRTRDPETLKACQDDPDTIVIDVGQIYEHENLCYDHHQSSFNEPLSGSAGSESRPMIPLSSCGLVYRHYGHAIIRKALLETYPDYQYSDDYLNDVYANYYKYFVLSIDANDNGIEYTKDEKWKLYNPVTLPSTVANFNSDEPDNDKKQLIHFHEAVQYCSLTFRKHLIATIRHKKNYYDGLSHFTTAMTTPSDLHTEGILILDRPLPVDQYLKEYDSTQHYKFILVPSNGQWKLWTVHKKGKRFETLKPLISELKAKEIVGDNLVFIHKTGFTGAAKTQDAAIAIARASAAVPVSDPDHSYMIGIFGALGLGLGLIIYHIWF